MLKIFKIENLKSGEGRKRCLLFDDHTQIVIWMGHVRQTTFTRILKLFCHNGQEVVL